MKGALVRTTLDLKFCRLNRMVEFKQVDTDTTFLCAWINFKDSISAFVDGLITDPSHPQTYFLTAVPVPLM